MKTKTIFATLAAVAAVSGVIGNFAQMKTATTNASVLANVEALTSGDDAPVKYFVFHMPVFDKNGNTTGECRADCPIHNNGTEDTSHSHGPKRCCS